MGRIEGGVEGDGADTVRIGHIRVEQQLATDLAAVEVVGVHVVVKVARDRFGHQVRRTLCGGQGGEGLIGNGDREAGLPHRGPIALGIQCHGDGHIEIGEVDGVDAVATIEHIVAGTAGKGVIPRTARQDVVRTAGGDDGVVVVGAGDVLDSSEALVDDGVTRHATGDVLSRS